jgi:hypothetical protein
LATESSTHTIVIKESVASEIGDDDEEEEEEEFVDDTPS